MRDVLVIIQPLEICEPPRIHFTKDQRFCQSQIYVLLKFKTILFRINFSFSNTDYILKTQYLGMPRYQLLRLYSKLHNTTVFLQS